MTKADKGKYSKKHDSNRPMDENLQRLVLDKIENTKITCSTAHTLATQSNSSPEEVGFVIDMLEARLTHCILGLFGYPDGKPVKEIPDKMDKNLLVEIKKLAVDRHLSCKDAWSIADKLKVGRLTVARTAEAEGIRINKCQLGAF